MASSTPSNGMYNLPNELLVPILQRLPPRDRAAANSVSIRWRAVFDETVGRKIFVGQPCPFSPTDEECHSCKYVQIEKIGEIGVSVCHVGEVVDPDQNRTILNYMWTSIRDLIFPVKNPAFKYPHLVKRIYFDGPIPSRYFGSMMTGLCCLSRLDIHHAALGCLTINNIESLFLPKLETLNIWGQSVHQGFVGLPDPVQVARVQTNIIKFLDIQFKYLKNFAIEYPFDILQEFELNKYLLKFLTNHCWTLERLKIDVDVYTLEDDVSPISANEIELYSEAKETSKSMRKIKNIEITITSLFTVRNLRVWIHFVKQQKRLEKFSIIAMRVPTEFLLELCQNNSNTLKSLWVTRLTLLREGQVNVFSCSILQMCTQLQSLILESLVFPVSIPLFQEVSLLPQSMRVIELSGVTISSTDVALLALEFPRLQELLLCDIGERGSLGMTLDILIEVIRMRQLNSLHLCDSFNGRFPSTGIFNGNLLAPRYLFCCLPGIFEITIGEHGYYICKENVDRTKPKFPTF